MSFIQNSIYCDNLSTTNLEALNANIQNLKLGDFDPSVQYDYIVVGMGAAGSILARKLSDDYTKKVLVIESGNNHYTDPEILSPNWVPYAADLLYNPEYSLCYPVSIPNTLSSVSYSEGCLWGGGAAHNFMVGVRGSKNIYDQWDSVSGNTGKWTYANLLPLMKALENYTTNGTVLNPLQRSTGGPISITQNDPLGNGHAILNQVSTISNTPFKDDYNISPTGDIAISAAQQLNTGPTGRRSYSALEFLPLGTVIDSNGNGVGGRQLKIVSNSKALKINFDPSLTATSVDFVNTTYNNTYSATAKIKSGGKLILSAGSVQSPKLLLNSGVGPYAQLTSAGINTVLDSPNIGQNLRCHYGPTATFTGFVPFEASVYSDCSINYPGILGMPHDGIRRIQMLMIPVGPGVCISILAILNPETLGSATITTPNLGASPNITYNFYSDGPVTTPGTDAFLTVTFFKIIAASVLAAGENMIFPPISHYPAPLGPALDDSLLLDDAKNLNALTLQSHIVGTAQLGTNISNGAVDSNLKVFGLTNVFVGDNSIQPISVDGNTCLAAYYIALKLSELLGH